MSHRRLPLWSLPFWLLYGFFMVLWITFVVVAKGSFLVLRWFGREVARYFEEHGPTPLEEDEVK